eukprot:12424559-Karenia_brevis.AAC.1
MHGEHSLNLAIAGHALPVLLIRLPWRTQCEFGHSRPCAISTLDAIAEVEKVHFTDVNYSRTNIVGALPAGHASSVVFRSDCRGRNARLRISTLKRITNTVQLFHGEPCIAGTLDAIAAVAQFARRISITTWRT